jgi:lipopolysaccharide export system protein LptC
MKQQTDGRRKKLDYQNDVTIDKYSLDEELVRQPALFMLYAKKAVKAIVTRDRARENLDVVRAMLDAEIRNNWETVFEKKPTETAITNWVIQQEKHKEASEQLIEARKQAGILEAAKEALNHKKSSLGKLVELFLAGYYSDVKLPDEKKEEVVGLKKEVQKETQKKLRKRLRK